MLVCFRSVHLGCLFVGQPCLDHKIVVVVAITSRNSIDDIGGH